MKEKQFLLCPSSSVTVSWPNFWGKTEDQSVHLTFTQMLSVSTVTSKGIKTSPTRIPLVIRFAFENISCCYISDWGRDELEHRRFVEATARILSLFSQCISDGSQIL